MELNPLSHRQGAVGRSEFYAEPGEVWLTDNGRALCSEHLGFQARFTGRDLSGQPILATSGLGLDHEVVCEGCGA